MVAKMKLFDVAKQDKEIKREIIVIIGIALLSGIILGPALLLVLLIGTGIYYLAKRKKKIKDGVKKSED